MSLLPDDGRMKPIIVIPPDTISADDIKELRANGLCVVVASDPAKVKFIDPIPSAAQRTKIENAAIQLSRKLITRQAFANTMNNASASSIFHSDIVKLFVELVVEGSPLDPMPSRPEIERRHFNEAKTDEVRKIAREEAREEAAARRAAKAAAKK